MRMLFIEYDWRDDGEIELVGLINAVEEDSQDPDGEAWLGMAEDPRGRRHGVRRCAPDDLTTMEETEDPEELRRIVERIILADRATKERVPS